MKFRLLQWNISYTEPVDEVVAVIRGLAPDVACLQELTRGYAAGVPDAGAYLAHALGMQGVYEYGPMALPDGAQADMGMGIFSNLPIEGMRRVLLQERVLADGELVQDERLFVRANIRLTPQISIVVGTTHLPFHPRFEVTPRRLAMARQVAGELAGRADCILAGDFNATPWSKVTRMLRQGMRYAGPAPSQPTWTTKPFEVAGYRYDELKWRLDHVLYRGQLRAVGAWLIDTPVSDHKPILVEFKA